MSVRLIWAQSRAGVIGANGGLPWHLPEDLKQFRQLTLGCTVVMGRRTWDSLPPTVRPLPGRRNVVLTRARAEFDGADTAADLGAALLTTAGDRIWVIGGASVYAAALPFADGAVVTEIDAEFDGDAYAPGLPRSWEQTESDPAAGWHLSSSGLRYRVRTYERAGAEQRTPIPGSV